MAMFNKTFILFLVCISLAFAQKNVDERNFQEKITTKAAKQDLFTVSSLKELLNEETRMRLKKIAKAEKDATIDAIKSTLEKMSGENRQSYEEAENLEESDKKDLPILKKKTFPNKSEKQKLKDIKEREKIRTSPLYAHFKKLKTLKYKVSKLKNQELQEQIYAKTDELKTIQKKHKATLAEIKSLPADSEKLVSNVNIYKIQEIEIKNRKAYIEFSKHELEIPIEKRLVVLEYQKLIELIGRSFNTINHKKIGVDDFEFKKILAEVRSQG